MMEYRSQSPVVQYQFQALLNTIRGSEQLSGPMPFFTDKKFKYHE